MVGSLGIATVAPSFICATVLIFFGITRHREDKRISHRYQFITMRLIILFKKGSMLEDIRIKFAMICRIVR
ncbi:hypothetical protein EN35_17210 [Rhodococcus qingshengii]|nr:hypothetical protein EN35_17210 [Rhodococcus qingshengii]